MRCSEVIKFLENWAPKEIAWERDNVGLQVGYIDREISNILLCLDVTKEVLDEAVKKKSNLIISHHPLLFHSLKKINPPQDKTSKIIELLLKNDITLYSAHTNLDFTRDGVSFELAKTLGLRKIEFLQNLDSNQCKLIIFVPESHLDAVANEFFKHGTGIIGNYTNCSFRTNGIGTFSGLTTSWKGSKESKPSAGRKEHLEKVEEVKLEVIVDSWKVTSILQAVKKVHPYEEMAYDVYPLKNNSSNYGVGAVGELEKTMTEQNFLDYVAAKLNIKNFRYTGGKNKKIKKVAVCGGSGSDFIKSAISAGADSFITADIRYHSFHDANKNILLIDAGHYETEIFSLNEIYKRLKSYTDVKIYKYSKSTNPIIFYNN
jgi:dinuclear metal center YbgI/SA1388 family protein